MTKPIIRIHNTETDEVIDREMTNSEFKQYQEDQVTESIRQAEAQAKSQAKAAAESKLAALGLTPNDLRALGL